MKFGRVLERAEQLGFDAVATGHHARVVDTPRRAARSRAAPIRPRTSRTCSTCSAPDELARTLLPDRRADEGRGARARAPRSGCAPRRSPRAWTSASSPRAAARRSSATASRAGPGAIVDTAGAERRRARRHRRVHDRSAARHSASRVGERRYVVDIAPGDRRRSRSATRDDLLRDRVDIDDAVVVARRAADRSGARRSARAHGAPCPGARRRRRVRVRRAAAARRARPGRRAATTATSCSAAASPRRADAVRRRRCGGSAARVEQRRCADRRDEHDVGVDAARRRVRPRRRRERRRLAQQRSRCCRPRVPSRRSSASAECGVGRLGPMPRDLLAPHQHRVERASAGRRRRRPPARARASGARARAASGARNAASGKPDDDRERRRATIAAVGEQQRSGRDARRRPATTASGTGPRNSGGGMRSGKRDLVAVGQRVPRRLRDRRRQRERGGDDASTRSRARR